MKMWVVLLVILLSLSSALGVRVVTKDELSKKGPSSDEIWISIMGEVYDVTNGKEYYGQDGPYQIFAGRAGDVPYITGQFTEDEAAKSIDVLTPAQVYSLESWRAFYANEDKYPFVGVFEGELYDKDGKPTDRMEKIKAIIVEEKKKADAREKERREYQAEKNRKAEEEVKNDL